MDAEAAKFGQYPLTEDISEVSNLNNPFFESMESNPSHPSNQKMTRVVHPSIKK